jgi:hypothetical protein
LADDGDDDDDDDDEEGDDVNVRGCDGCCWGDEAGDEEVWIAGRVISGMAGNEGAGIDDAGL